MARANNEILLVDDSVDDVELAVSVLSTYWPADKITVVHDGAEACDYLYRRGQYSQRGPGQPVLLLLDIKMPRVDGLEVLRQLRADPALMMTPVVMLTSSREEHDLLRCYRLGVNGYVVKPVEFESFSQAVAKLGVFWALVNEPPPLPALAVPNPGDAGGSEGL